MQGKWWNATIKKTKDVDNIHMFIEIYEAIMASMKELIFMF